MFVIKQFCFTLLFTLWICSLNGQVNWTNKNLFEQKVFVENKGQFDENIKYAISNQGVDIYFTLSGVIYKHVEQVKFSEEEKDKIEKLGVTQNFGSNKEENSTKPKSYFLNMRWSGANPDVRVIAEDAVSNYFTYGDLEDRSGKSTIKANAFKKIIYQNIYPYIDIEYIFPQNKEGIKYSFILHPGADASVIKMKYDGAEKLFADAEGNIKIESAFGDFTDHIPIAYYQNGKNIKSSFIVNSNSVFFQLEDYDKTKTIVIDPWTTTPLFTGANSAYDIDWDYKGNIYVYGGKSPYQLIKLNNSGTVIWTYTSAFSNTYYGDFAVDRNTGTAYICETKTNLSGAGMIKVNTSGVQVTMFPGNSNINEMWRIAYNSCTNQGVIGCGNTSQKYQAATFDTNLTNISAVNILSVSQSYVDIALLAIDDTNCYMLSSENGIQSLANTIVKAPLGTLWPSSYYISSGHHFKENSSVLYTGSRTNGFNGMAKSKKYLYTYDGAILKKWNPAKGTFLNSTIVSIDTFDCGGIAVDACDNVYIGCINSVKQYDSTLTLVGSTATSSSVYDLALADGEIFACGNNFVSALPLYSPCSISSPIKLTTSSSPSTCAGNDGTVTVSVTGGSPPFNYLWMPGGKTTQTVNSLIPGTYKITVSESNGTFCNRNRVYTGTTTVSASSGFTKQSISNINVTCFGGNDGSATITVAGGTMPYTYLWSPTGETTNTITGLSEGSYTVKVKDLNGCQTIDSIKILSLNPQPTPKILGTTSICEGNASILTVKGGNTYIWNTGETTTTINVSPVNNTTYTVTGTIGPCSNTATVTVYVNPLPVITVNSPSICTGQTANLTANGGTAYTWSMGATPTGVNTADVSPIATTTYTVTGMSGICYNTAVATVFVFPLPTVNAGADVTINAGASTQLNATGGGTYSWSPSDGLSCTSCQNPFASPLQTTTYKVIVTDTNGCMAADYVTISIDCGEVFVPNAFSPNNDNANDLECVFGKCIETMEFAIYDRWGEKVFETTDPKICWDGIYNGKLMETAVFVYYFNATLVTGENIIKKGNISLIR